MKRIRSLLCVAAAGALLGATDLVAAGRTFVSAANGNDSNPCTRALPCRSFVAALSQTDPDGEVIVLDSGGYGVVTINQPVSLISPAGVHAGITAFSGNAVTVNAGDTAHVILRNLSLNSQGAAFGIDADTVAALYVEGCVINGFGNEGILFDPTTAGARLYVSDTVVRRSAIVGIHVIGGTGIRATIDSVQLYENTYSAVAVYNAEAIIRDSVASGSPGNPAFWAQESSAKVIIEKSVASNNLTGFFAGGGTVMIMTRCAAFSNTKGVAADGSGVIYVSDSKITSNSAGVSTSSGGVVTSRGNNTLQANTTNGAFNGSFPPN